MGQISFPTKPASTSEPHQEKIQEEAKPTGELESEPKPVPTPKGSGSPPPTALDDMAVAARWILLENSDIAQRMLKHLRTQPLVPLRSEDLVTLPKPVEDQPRAAEMQS